MTTFSIQTFKELFITLLAEAMEGKEESTWYLDGGLDTTLPGYLDTLTAEEASRTTVDGGTTIAAHTEHVRWFLARSNAHYRGEKTTTPWSESWLTVRVDDGQWKTLRKNLVTEYMTLKKAIESRTDFSDETFLMGTSALLPHIAYHLGAIRQIGIAVKKGKK